MRIRLAILVAVLLSVPRISQAQAPATTGAPPQLSRVYVDVNLLGYGDPLGQAKTFVNYALKFGEVATFTATYPKPSRPGVFPVYVGGGFMLKRWAGVGVSYSRMSRESVADLSATVPDPTFFGALATDTGTTGTTLSRHESALHISLALVPVRSSRLEFRMMGGPSFFTLKGDMVGAVEYEQTSNSLIAQNVITINGVSSREASGSAFGFHVGADFTYFVHRFVGIAGGVRYGRATVVMDAEPLSNIRQEFLVGGTTVFLGLRFRLGPAHFDK
jgi:hypothetical protein